MGVGKDLKAGRFMFEGLCLKQPKKNIFMCRQQWISIYRCIQPVTCVFHFGNEIGFHGVWTLLSGFKFQMVALSTHLEGNCMNLDRQRPKAELTTI